MDIVFLLDTTVEQQTWDEMIIVLEYLSNKVNFILDGLKIDAKSQFNVTNVELLARFGVVIFGDNNATILQNLNDFDFINQSQTTQRMFNNLNAISANGSPDPCVLG